uniref:Uncharacterized protein n=1 Tax=Rhizophora mucronata TaxID=61149 RepID=A0A2P2KD40_RHIMU
MFYEPQWNCHQRHNQQSARHWQAAQPSNAYSPWTQRSKISACQSPRSLSGTAQDHHCRCILLYHSHKQHFQPHSKSNTSKVKLSLLIEDG